MARKNTKRDNQEAPGDKKLSLAPLGFEEALRGLLEVAPPPKGERPEPEPEDKPKRKGRPKKADSEKGSR